MAYTKKNPVIISVVFKPVIMAIELCGFNVYWTDTNEAVITLVHRLMVENVPESCVAFMATSKPCSKCCS